MGGLLAFRVGNFDNTAEREQFRFLCEQLKAHYENSNEFCVFVGNYNIGCELDALFIKKDAIIAIEFKNYGGNVIANENGEWTCDGKVIKGGYRKTVLQQARINHSIVKKELKVLGVESKQIKDVPTLVVFHQPIELTNNLSATNKSWLHITDDAHFVEKLDDITCPNTDLEPLDIVNLAELLNLNSFYLTEFSNAVYDKPTTAPKQLDIFEEIKLYEPLISITGNSEDTKKDENEAGALLVEQTDSINHTKCSFDTPEELKPLRNYAIQILQVVCKDIHDYNLHVVSHLGFVADFPEYKSQICQENIIFVVGKFCKDDKLHLSRFLNKEVTTIDDNHFFWQTGDLVVSQNPEEAVKEDDDVEVVLQNATNSSVSIPVWMDDYIFNKLKAKYSPDHVRFEYNLNLSREEVLVYLGTYFPRSFMETNLLFAEFSSAVAYNEVINNKSEIKILDLECGTGGEIFGVLSFIEDNFKNIDSIKLLAIDGNQESLRAFEKVMSCFKSRSRLKIDYIIGPAFIENKEDLDTIAEVVSDKYDIVLSCKAICEMLAKNRFKHKSYKSTAEMLSSKLSDDGVLFIEDVTVKSPATNEFIPVTLNCELNEFIRETNEFVTIYPRSCAVKGDRCLNGCFFKQEFKFSHSHKKNDITKVVFRFIGRKQILDKLILTDNNTLNCKIL